MVPRVGHRVGDSWHRRDCPVRHNHGGFDGVLRMDPCVCKHHRVCRCVHGGALGRIFLAPAGGDSVWNNRTTDARETGDQRRGLDFRDVHILSVGGLYELIAALWTHLSGWGWQALGGIVTAIMGGLILADWPISGLWVIGLFVGIEVIFYGLDWIRVALELHKM